MGASLPQQSVSGFRRRQRIRHLQKSRRESRFFNAPRQSRCDGRFVVAQMPWASIHGYSQFVCDVLEMYFAFGQTLRGIVPYGARRRVKPILGEIVEAPT